MKISVLVAAISIALGSSALAETTKWEAVNKSLEELLNNGWEPVPMSSQFADTHNFLLRKNGKFVVCSLHEHSGGVFSSCKALN